MKYYTVAFSLSLSLVQCSNTIGQCAYFIAAVCALCGLAMYFEIVNRMGSLIINVRSIKSNINSTYVCLFVCECGGRLNGCIFHFYFYFRQNGNR